MATQVSQHPPARELSMIYSKISWRLLPVLVVSFVIAFLDRINIGYAQLQMKQTLPFGDAVYGLGAGIFFIGYLVFELPSNLALKKIGARKTLLRIMVCWGLAASAMAFVSTPTQFYIVRFLLGAFEAGFLPGIILYFTYWYPSARRGQVIALFMLAPLVAGSLAGPLCGATLKHLNGVGAWHGWQWLFVLQGLPAVLLGVMVYLLLKDKPDDAEWLTQKEKDLVRHDLRDDKKAVAGGGEGGLLQLLRNPRIYCLALIYFFLLGSNYTMAFWTPTLIQSWGVKDMLAIGIYAAIPNVIGLIGIVAVARNSDRTRERRWHFFSCAALGVLGLWLATLMPGNLAGSILALAVVGIGLGSTTPLFMTIVSEYLSPAAAAGGIALISTLGNFGPAVAPVVNGLILQRTGTSSHTLHLVMVMLSVAGVLLLMLVRTRRPPATLAAASTM